MTRDDRAVEGILVACHIELFQFTQPLAGRREELSKWSDRKDTMLGSARYGRIIDDAQQVYMTEGLGENGIRRFNEQDSSLLALFSARTVYDLDSEETARTWQNENIRLACEVILVL